MDKNVSIIKLEINEPIQTNAESAKASQVEFQEPIRTTPTFIKTQYHIRTNRDQTIPKASSKIIINHI